MASQQPKVDNGDQTNDGFPSMRSVDASKPPTGRKRQLVNKESSVTASPKLKGQSAVECDLTEDSPVAKTVKRKLFAANEVDDDEDSIEEWSDGDGLFAETGEPTQKKQKMELGKTPTSMPPPTPQASSSKVKQERRKSPKKRQSAKHTTRYEISQIVVSDATKCRGISKT